MREIKEIYNDVIEWFLNSGLKLGDEYSDFSCHTGDSLQFDNTFLEFMYNRLIDIVNRTRYNTHNSAFTPSAFYIFDSGWYTFTSDQYTEMNEVLNEGYNTEGYSGGHPTSTSIDKVNMDENGNFYKPVSYGGRIFNGEYTRLYSRSAESHFDVAQLSDFQSVKDGLFFDTSLFLIETNEDIYSWFEQYDLILTDLLSSENHIIYGLQGRNGSPDVNALSIQDSDIYGGGKSTPSSSSYYDAKARYSSFAWYDDKLESEGEIVKKDGYYGTSPLFQRAAYCCYSEGLTVKHDDGNGGYEEIVYSTIDNGVSFSDDLRTIQNIAQSTYSSIAPEGYYPFYSHYPATYTIDDIEYIGGEISSSLDGEITEAIHTYEDIIDNFKNMSRTRLTGEYSIKNYILDIGEVDAEIWEKTPVLVDELQKKPSDIINMVAPRASEFDYTIELPVFPAEGQWSASLKYATIAGFEISPVYRDYVLQPPQA